MNIRDNLKAFYVGNRQGTAIYVGSTKVWPIDPCNPITFIDPVFGSQVKIHLLDDKPVTDCNIDSVKSWYYPNTSNKSAFTGSAVVTNEDYKKFNVPASNDDNVVFMRLFQSCADLTTFDTGMVEGGEDKLGLLYNMGGFYCTLQGCTSLTTIIGDFDGSKIYNYNGMFRNCRSLITAPNITFPHRDYLVTHTVNVSILFDGCTSLTTIPLYDAYSWEYLSLTFNGLSNLENVGGFKDIGKCFTTNSYAGLNFEDSPKLTNQSVQNIINNLATPRESLAGVLKLAENVYNSLTEEQKSQITSKGWSVTY